MIFSEDKAADEFPESVIASGLRVSPPRGAVGLPEALPPISWRRIPHVRAHSRLGGKDRVCLRPPHVPARRQRRLSRTLRWRLAERAFPLDAGLSARGPSFFAGPAAVDPHPCAVGGAADQP